MRYAVWTRRGDASWMLRGTYTTEALAQNARRLYVLAGNAVVIRPCIVFA